MKFIKPKWRKEKHIIRKLLIISLVNLFVVLPTTSFIVEAAIIDDENVEKENTGLFESILSKTILGFADSLIGITGAQDVSVLVFQQPEIAASSEAIFSNTQSAYKENLVYGIFPKNVFNGIEVLYSSFNNAISTPIVIMITLAGVILAINIFKNADDRSQIKEIALGIMIAVLLGKFGMQLWGIATRLNELIVGGVYETLISQGINITSFISTIWEAGSTDVFSSKNLLVALIVFCAVFMTFTINWQYNLRMIMLGMLILLFPIVVVLMVWPSKRSVLGVWFQLFAQNVFLQTTHAIVLGLFFLILHNAQGFEFWLVLVMFFGFPACVDLGNRVIGMAFGESFNAGGLGKTASNMTGLSSVLGMAMMAKNMIGDKGNFSTTHSSNRSMVDNNIANQAINSTMNKAPQSAAPIQTGINNKNEVLNTQATNNQKNHSNQNMNGVSGDNNSFINGGFNSNAEHNSNALQNHNTVGTKNEQTSFEQKANEFKTNANNQQNGNMSNQNLNHSNQALNSFNARNTSAMIQEKVQNISNKTGTQLRNLGQLTGTGIVKTSEFARNSRGLRTSAKVATIAAGIAAGSALSTMATGNGRTGALIGAGAGAAASGIGNIAVDKTSRATQVAGEAIQSKSQGRGALDVTKDRIGFKDKSQLADRAEMSRMGRELIGGDSGARAAEKISDTIMRKGGNSPIVQRQNKRIRLEQEHLPNIQTRISNQQMRIKTAETNFKNAMETRNVNRNPQSQKIVEVQHAKLQRERKQLTQLESQQQHMERHLHKFYDIEKIRNDAQKLRKQRA